MNYNSHCVICFDIQLYAYLISNIASKYVHEIKKKLGFGKRSVWTQRGTISKERAMILKNGKRSHTLYKILELILLWEWIILSWNVMFT